MDNYGPLILLIGLNLDTSTNDPFVKPASLHQLKLELRHLSKEEVIDLCLKLARQKKDSKELLTYLLFEADNEAQYIAEIKGELEAEFHEMNITSVYYAKKSTQRIVRKLNKYLRISGKKQTKVELLLWFCETLLDSDIPVDRSKILINLLNRQLDAAHKALGGLHEDLQYDYRDQIETLKQEVVLLR